MNRSHFLVLGVLGLTLVSPLAPRPADAQVTKQGNAYLLRMKFTPGQTIRHRISTSGDMMPQPMIITSAMRVTRVANGIATIETSTQMPAARGQKAPEPIKQTVQMNNRGVIQGQQQGMGASTPTLPEKPVRVGESWTGSVAGMAGLNMNARYTLAGIKNVGGRQVAEITMSMTGNMSGGGGPSRMSGQGRMNLDMRDGSMLNGTVNFNMTLPGRRGEDGKPGKPQTFKMTTTMTRV